MIAPANRSDVAPASMPFNAVSVIGFAYESLEPAQADIARAAAGRIRDRLKMTTLAAIATGRDLLAVKERLGPGAYGAWRLAEFGMSERTSQHYMLAATEFGDKAATVAVLPPTTVYALAAPSTPETIRADVLRQLEEGHRPEPAKILSTISEAKRNERDRRKAERKAKTRTDMLGRRGKLPPEAQAEWDREQDRKAKIRERQEAKQQVEQQARIQRLEAAADDIAGLIAERLGDDLAGALASSEDPGVWYQVRTRLKVIRAQSSNLETTVQSIAAA